MDVYHKFHNKTSLRAILLGKDPSDTPKILIDHQSSWFNRSFFVDLYAIVWPCIEIILLYFLGSRLLNHPILTLIVGCWAIYRLHEITGGILHVLLHRSSFDHADERKMILTLLCYIEPILIFAIFYAVLFIVIPFFIGNQNVEIFSINKIKWGGLTAFYFSAACYTTVGWGDISAKHPLAMLLAGCESIFGVIMLTLTISVFISRAIQNDKLKPDE